LYLLELHSSHSIYTGGRKCISIFLTPSHSQVAHLHCLVLKLNLHGPYHLTCASLTCANTSLIGVNTPVYVAGLERGVFPIADWSITTALSKFSSHLISLTCPTCLLALLSSFIK